MSAVAGDMPGAEQIRPTQFPVLNREAAATYLHFLDPEADGFTFQTFTDSDQTKRTYGKNLRTGRIIDRLAKVLHGSLEQHYPTLVDLSRAGAGIFVTVNRTKNGRRSAENITRIRAYFVDCDGVPKDEIQACISLLRLRPHIITRSSPGKYHSYWCISDAPLAAFAETQRKLALLFDSDPSVCDLPRVMRIPGFPHQKDGSIGDIVSLLYTSGIRSCSNSEFQIALDKALAQRQQKRSLAEIALKNLVPAPPDWNEGYSEGQRNNECARRAGSCFAKGMTLEEALEKCQQWNRECNSPPLTDDEVAATVASIANTHSGRTGQNSFGTKEETNNANANNSTNGSPPRLPRIPVVGGGLSNEATAGEDAILQNGLPIYQRDKMLVRPVVQEVDATRGRRTNVAQLAAINPHYLRDVLGQSAEWCQFDGRKNKQARIDPPFDVAQTILSRFGQWKFPAVVGLISTPTLRPDGSLLAQPGYDPETRLILAAPPPISIIPDQPTREDALAAVTLLKALLEEFPFAGKASLSVALSCLITPVVRAAFPVAPMHVACAPTSGTGKSFLFDVAAAIAIGHPCPVMAAGRNEEETEKRLGAALITGQPIINIDNVNGELGGDALCQVIERPLVEIRILGKSERARIESRSTVFATGNNLRLLGDMTRRGIVCVLDARQERPELREFKGDPVAEVLADRGRYVAAALTIVRAYIVAGRPRVATALSSFEGWSKNVRSALIWLGYADPVETMETARREDPNLRAMEAVFAALKEVIGVGSEKACSVAEIINRANEHEFRPGGLRLKYPGAKEAFEHVAGDRNGAIQGRELGKYLSRQKGRVALYVRLDGDADRHGHAARWWLADCG